MLLLATLIWGSAFVSQSVGMDYIGPFTFQAVRCGLAVLALLPVIWLVDRRKKGKKSFGKGWADKKLWIAGLLCGIPLFLACNLQQIGLVETDAGKSAFLTAMYIVIVPLISIFMREKPTILTPFSVALAVAGLYFLSCMGVTRISTHDILLMCCALMFAIQIVCVDIFTETCDALRLNAIQAGVCAVLSAVLMLFWEQPTWSGIAACWLPLCHTGLLSMGAAYSLQILGQRDLSPATACLIMSLESVFAALFGAVLLKETMTQWEILGCVLVFVAVLLSQVPLPVKKKAAKPTQ